jgi:ADP-ribose pyrophosphatase YjhB (NUDIX family)
MITCTFEDGGKGLLRHVTVDIIVIKNKKILLVKRTGSISDGGKWGIIGGFVERDETIKQAAEREIFEETGWKVKDLTLLRIKDWPDRPHEDRQNIAFVYFCIAMDKKGSADCESDERKWFDLDNLPPRNQIAFDHADDITFYQKYLKELSIKI